MSDKLQLVGVDSPRRRRLAAFSVFFINIATVNNPTPPGTGVDLPATSIASKVSRRQLMNLFRENFESLCCAPEHCTSSGSVNLFIPTSITTPASVFHDNHAGAWCHNQQVCLAGHAANSLVRGDKWSRSHRYQSSCAISLPQSDYDHDTGVRPRMSN